MLKRVLILYNGGTIGMRPSEQGYAPQQGFLQEQMQALPALKHAKMPHYDIIEQQPLIDSANMYPDRWWGLARLIAQHYDAYDGFVVLHGTDTMAYTTSALPFLLEGLQKPVIVTGSQIPLCEVRNDAQANLITSLLLAAYEPLPEVCLFFGGRLMRGCRAVKLDASGFMAFASPNYPLLGEAGIELEVYWERVRKTPEQALQIRPLAHTNVSAVRLFPGISPSVLENMLQDPLQGLVLETYGAGNAPVSNPVFVRVLRQAVERGVVIVNCTQCLRGRVKDVYATGAALAEIGVTSGLDMTTEAALAKLHYLLGLGLTSDGVRAQLTQNLRGELSPRRRRIENSVRSVV